MQERHLQRGSREPPKVERDLCAERCPFSLEEREDPLRREVSVLLRREERMMRRVFPFLLGERDTVAKSALLFFSG